MSPKGRAWLFALAFAVTSSLVVVPDAARKAGAGSDPGRPAALQRAGDPVPPSIQARKAFGWLKDETGRDRLQYPTALVVDLTDRGVSGS